MLLLSSPKEETRLADNNCNCARPVTPPYSAAPEYRDQRLEQYSLLSEFKATETQTSGPVFYNDIPYRKMMFLQWQEFPLSTVSQRATFEA